MERIPLDVNHLIQSHLAGESVKSIAARLGVSRQVITLRLNEAGIQQRNRSESMAVRMAQASPEERAALSAAAHEAARGRVASEAEQVKRAATRERKQVGASPVEDLFAAMLVERGLDVVQQKAVGRYNCDIAASPIAVEIYGGHWHFAGRHLARADRRMRHFADQGWHVLVVLVTSDWPLRPESADYVVAWQKEAEGNPSAPRKYRMIGGAAELLTAQRLDAHKLALEYPRGRTRDAGTGRYNGVTR